MKKRLIPAAVARNLNAPKRDVSTLPGCGVGGMARPGAMCGSVIVGGKLCGHDGECQHKVPNAQ
jgi:hypothetical protein